MYQASIEVSFDSAHRLLEYEGKCHNLHGHTYVAIVRVSSADLNSDGFVVDFGVIKKFVKGWIDEHWDHSCFLSIDDPLLKALDSEECRVFVFSPVPTAEVMAADLFVIVNDWLISKAFKNSVNVYSVSIKETATSEATYCALDI